MIRIFNLGYKIVVCVQILKEIIRMKRSVKKLKSPKRSRQDKESATPSYGFYELLFLTFRRLLRNPTAAIMMLTLFQVMTLPQAEAKKDFDWSGMPEGLDLDMHEMDPQDLDVREMDLDVTDLTDQMQTQELTDLRTEDITKVYQRYLATEDGAFANCLPPSNATHKPYLFDTIGTSDVEYGYDIATAEDGSVWVTGLIAENTTALDRDVLLLKYSSTGSLLHALKWGGALKDEGWALAIDSHSSVWLTGFTQSFKSGGDDVLLLKFSSECELLKALTWGNTIGYQQGRTLVIDSQDTLYISGISSGISAGGYDALFLKISSEGALLQSLAWGGSNTEHISSLAIDGQGALWGTGFTKSFGASGFDVLVVKFSSSGELLKALTWGRGLEDWGKSIVVDSQERVWIGGHTDSFGSSGDRDALILNISPEGKLLKALSWGSESAADAIDGVVIDNQGFLWASGYTYSFGAVAGDAFLMKLSLSSELLMAESWGGTAWDNVFSLAIGEQSSIWIAGKTNSFGVKNGDLSLTKLDSQGRIEGLHTSVTQIDLTHVKPVSLSVQSQNVTTGTLTDITGISFINVSSHALEIIEPTVRHFVSYELALVINKFEVAKGVAFDIALTKIGFEEGQDVTGLSISRINSTSLPS